MHLKKMLPADQFDVRDFDERGVPDGGGLDWHNRETRKWLDIAATNAKEDRSTIICGYAEHERFRGVHTSEDVPGQLILLHASGDTIRERLLGRYPTAESIKEINRASGVPLDKFIENNVSYAPTLRTLFEKEGAPIIETDNKSPEKVAGEIVGLVK